MGCSDSYAQMLEDSDPDFRARNDFNGRASELARANWVAMCAMGVAAYETGRQRFESLGRIKVPRGNGYIDRDTEFSRSMGGVSSAHIRANEAADAAESLKAWGEGKGDGSVAFKWLIEHWGMDLALLARENERHQRESVHLLAKGRGESDKYRRRQARLAADIPEAAAVALRVEWAKSQVRK